MDKIQLQKLRDLPIEGVAERLGLRVSRHKSLCPFHADSHPSLSYSTSKNMFRCFVCEAKGGTIDLVMRHLRRAKALRCKPLCAILRASLAGRGCAQVPVLRALD